VLFSHTLQLHCQKVTVCLSSSVMQVYCDKTTEARITQFTPKIS